MLTLVCTQSVFADVLDFTSSESLAKSFDELPMGEPIMLIGTFDYKCKIIDLRSGLEPIEVEETYEVSTNTGFYILGKEGFAPSVLQRLESLNVYAKTLVGSRNALFLKFFDEGIVGAILDYDTQIRFSYTECIKVERMLF